VAEFSSPMLADALRDRYVLERELGRGGMATVWLARDVKHDRLVALKVLRADLSAILGGERFLREIRLTAALQHPHILPVLDSGEAGGILYYLMPYVEGESLRHRLDREGQLPLEEVIRLTRGVVAALEYAHRQAVIHRDIKPENILLYQGEPMVADFGIALAAATAGRERLTETGLSLGTPAYMSPEQASASGRLDSRSDQYSLACVVYEMLAGEPPYTGPTAQAIIAKRFSEPVPRLSTVRAVPVAVEDAVTRALAKAPADRFASVAEFADALERPISTPRRFASRRMAALLGGLTVLGLLATLGWLLRGRAPTPVVSQRQLTFTGNATEPVLSPDAKSVAYVSLNKSLVVQRLDGGDPVVLVPPSRWLFHPRWTGDGTAILFCMMPDSNRLAATWMVPSVGGSAHEVLPDIDAFDAGPDSLTAIWSQRETHRIELVELRTHRVRQALRIADSLGVINDLAWSPDRRWIAFEADGIWISPIGEGAPRRLAKSGWQPRWSAAGDAVYFLDGPRGTTDLKKIRVDPRSGAARGTPSRVLSLPTADQFSLGPSGVMVHTQVALSSQALAIRYSGTLPRRIEETRAITGGTGWVNSLAISDDGEQVAMSRGQGGETSISVVPFQGGSARIVAGSPAQELAPIWSADGTRLAFVRSDSAGARLMVVDYPDGAPQRLGSASPIPALGSAFWSADGQWLTYRASDLKRIGIVNLGRQAESFLRIPDSLGTGYSGGGLISPDGREIVVSTIHRWNDWGELWLASAGGGSWRRLQGPFGESYPLRWTADARLYLLNCRAFFTDGGQCHYQLWRVRMPDGKPEFVAAVPEGCGGSFSLSRDGRRAVCDYNTRQSDLVVATGFDPDIP
jgi:eukaryotic-like serine/threonine-protein kinase